MFARFVVAVSLVLCAGVVQAKPPDVWGFEDWSAAVARAKAEKKPLFVLFGYEDCQWCEYMYRRGMNDADLRASFQKAAVLTYVDTKSHAPEELFVMPDGTQVTHADFIKKYSAYPTPSWIFLSGSGELLQSGRNGKTTTRELQRDLEAAVQKF